MKFSEMTIEQRLQFLEDKCRILDDENVGTTNALYELENRMQSQIDALINYTMQLKSEIRQLSNAQWEETNDVY